MLALIKYALAFSWAWLSVILVWFLGVLCAAWKRYTKKMLDQIAMQFFHRNARVFRSIAYTHGTKVVTALLTPETA